MGLVGIARRQVGCAGAGNLANAVLIGMGFKPEEVKAWSPGVHSGRRKTNYLIAENNAAAAAFAKRYYMITSKPAQVGGVCDEVAPVFQAQKPEERPLVLIFAAGIRMQFVNKKLPEGTPTAIVVANTAAKVRESMFIVLFNEYVTKEQRAMLITDLSLVGKVEVFSNERLMNLLMYFAGSGPAINYFTDEVMIELMVEEGVPRESAEIIWEQVKVGSGKLYEESGLPRKTLRENITSEGGITHEAISSLMLGSFKAELRAAMKAAVRRADSIGEEAETAEINPKAPRKNGLFPEYDNDPTGIEGLDPNFIRPQK
ncbi:MAG: pyrroline-5-carboxylate reductase dimerization domain-containing protein [Legionella sp.]|nr:pyrroline-5-carboxylate reductase dimerization domain-containing protein [Legionella sp.]